MTSGRTTTTSPAPRIWPVSLAAALTAGLAYTAVHLFWIRPLIHQENGLCLIVALTHLGGMTLPTGDPWWSGDPVAFAILPKLRLYILYYLYRLLGDPHTLAAVGSTAYAVLAAMFAPLWGRWLGVQRRHLLFLFALWTILPFGSIWSAYWDVGLSHGFKDSCLLAVFLPPILALLGRTLEEATRRRAVLLALVCSAYFYAHPTQALLWLPVPLLVLVAHAGRPRHWALAGWYLLVVSICCLPYLLHLALAQFGAAIPYDKWFAIYRQRFNYAFPDITVFRAVVSLAHTLGLAQRTMNYLMAALGIPVLAAYTWLVRRQRGETALVAGLALATACAILLDYWNLTLLAALGWFLRLRNRPHAWRREAWLAFWPLPLFTLSWTAHALWTGINYLSQHALVMHQFLAYVFCFPWLIAGGWELLSRLAGLARSRLLSGLTVVVGGYYLFVWYWWQQWHKPPLVLAAEAALATLWLALAGERGQRLWQNLRRLVAEHPLTTYAAGSLLALGVLHRQWHWGRWHLGLALVLLTGLGLWLYRETTTQPQPRAKPLARPLVMALAGILAAVALLWPGRDLYWHTAFGEQIAVSRNYHGLAQAILRHVPPQGRLLTAPYFTRLMTRRYVWWTKKDANFYLFGRQRDMLRLWSQRFQRLQACLARPVACQCLAEIMRQTRCPYVAFPRTQKLCPRLFRTLYDKGWFALYQLRQPPPPPSASPQNGGLTPDKGHDMSWAGSRWLILGVDS